MTNFFSSISDFISLGWDMLMNSIRSLITVFTVLSTSVASHQVFISLMPSFISACAMIVIGITVVKFIVNRIGGYM